MIESTDLLMSSGMPLDGLSTSVLIVLISVMLLFLIGVYIYTSLAWYKIAKKLKHKNPWLAWIPFANISLMLELGNFSWAWVFLVLIPIAAIIPLALSEGAGALFVIGIILMIFAILAMLALAVLVIIANWKTFERRKHPGWYSLAPIIPYAGSILYLVAIGLVAWQDKK